MSAKETSHRPAIECFPAFEYVPPAINSQTIVATPTAKTAERPIRFPHIPAFNQSPPGAAQYVLLNNRELRVDRPHPPVELKSPSGHQTETAPIPRPQPAPIPASTPVAPAKPNLAEVQARTGLQVPTAQIEQIAEYLRKKRSELESEQTDLQLNTLKQQTALLQEKEQLRGQQLNIQMVQATLEILRRQLIDFGESLSAAAGTNNALQAGFEAVCQAYFDAAQVAKLLDSGS